MYRVSTLSTQLITKLSKMNRFTVLECQNQLSTTLYKFLLGTQHPRGITFFVASLDSLQHGSLLDVMETRASISLPKLGPIHTLRPYWERGWGSPKADDQTDKLCECDSYKGEGPNPTSFVEVPLPKLQVA